MRPKLAERKVGAARKVLVLGLSRRGLGVAEQVAKRLEAEGLEPVAHAQPLPKPTDDGALEALRALLRQFADQAGAGSLVHPAITPWAERPELPSIAESLELGVICPPGRVLSLFNNKLNLLAEGEKAGVPNLLLGFDPMHSVREIERLIAHSGTRSRFPYVLKAVRGGRAWGLIVVTEEEDLRHKVPLWFEQLRRNVGEVIVFAERYLEGARRVLVPFARFNDGRFKSFPIADGSLQHRNRKILEFCPAPSIEPSLDTQIREWTERLAQGCGYVGVGTLDFMIEGNLAYLVDGTARLNLGFSLWDTVCETNAVAWQLAAMEGGKGTRFPKSSDPVMERSGVSLRIHAEDPLLHLPQPGRVRELGAQREWKFPGTEAELTLTVEAGVEVPADGDGLVGMLLVIARDRKLALTAARGVLSEIWIAGALQTSERFLAELVSHPWVREGIFHAGFVEEEFVPAVRPPSAALRALATIGAALVPGGDEVARWAVGDQWVKPEPSALKWAEGPETWTFKGGPGISGTVLFPDNSKARVSVFPLADDKWQARIGSWTLALRRVVAAPGGARRAPRILALAAGKVHSILYRAGAVVPAHEPLLLVESLGVLVPHALPVDVLVRAWKVAADDAVVPGQDLAEFEISN